MKHKVSELEGALLDAAVAMAEGRKVWFRLESGVSVPYTDRDRYDRWWPSQQWAQGGPIIERERISVLCLHGKKPADPPAWVAGFDPAISIEFDWRGQQEGGTPLIAAMRAYVASKLGEEVEL